MLPPEAASAGSAKTAAKQERKGKDMKWKDKAWTSRGWKDKGWEDKDWQDEEWKWWMGKDWSDMSWEDKYWQEKCCEPPLHSREMGPSTPAEMMPISTGVPKEPPVVSERSKKALEERGWTLIRVPEGHKPGSMRDALAAFLNIRDPAQLGKGRDAKPYPRKYSSLVLEEAWEVRALDRDAVYQIEQRKTTREVKKLYEQGIAIRPEQTKLDDCIMKISFLLESEPLTLINEKLLLHGTKPQRVIPILHQGLSERLSSMKGVFGAGVYLAEDAEKIDQYTEPDKGEGSPGCEELHAALFPPGGEANHCGEDLFYCFVVQTILGAAVHTQDGDTDCVNVGQKVFANAERRELNTIPGSSLPQRHHSMVVEISPAGTKGSHVARYRELLSFSSARLRLAYLLAYRRV